MVKTGHDVTFPPLTPPFWVGYIGLILGLLLTLITLRLIKYEAGVLMGYILALLSSLILLTSLALGLLIPNLGAFTFKQ